MLKEMRMLLGEVSFPPELLHVYMTATNMREALVQIKEARRRDESRRRRNTQDVIVLDKLEEELFEEGKNEVSDDRRLRLAVRIRDIRWKKAELNDVIDNILSLRLREFNRHALFLETMLELLAEPTPDNAFYEKHVAKAKEEFHLERLESVEYAEGIAFSRKNLIPDPEEEEILREIDQRAAGLPPLLGPSDGKGQDEPPH